MNSISPKVHTIKEEEQIRNHLKDEEQVSLTDAVASLGITKVKKNQGHCIIIGKNFFDVSNVETDINIEKFYIFPSPLREELLLRFILTTSNKRSIWSLQIQYEKEPLFNFLGRRVRTEHMISSYYNLSFSYKKSEDPLLVWLCEKILLDKSGNPNPSKKKIIQTTLKRLVWNKEFTELRGNALCPCCKLTTISQLNFHCGHIIAEAKGGSTKLENLIPICQSCNSSMGTKNMHDFMRSQGF